MKTCIAIRHLPFESLDAWESPISERFDFRYHDAPTDAVTAGIDPDLLIVLGGPVGANDGADYPFIDDTVALLRKRLAGHKPTLGICLGAQLMAVALDAKVIPGDQAEIGWIPLTLSPAGIDSPLKRLDGVPVFHWHNDRFDIPAGTRHLASTPQCDHQAFALGSNILALQFHPEVTARQLETWYVGHHRSLSDSDEVDVHRLREDAGRYGDELQAAGEKMLEEWLQGIEW